MSLNFGTSGDFVNCGSSTTIDNVWGSGDAIGTVLTWFRFDTLPSTSGHPQRWASQGNDKLCGSAGSDNFICSINRGTLSQLVFASFANCANWPGVGEWAFGAYVFDTSAGNTDQKLYIGSLTAFAAEPSSYTIQRVGSGTVTDSTAKNYYLGSNPDATNEITEGPIARHMLFSTALSADEIKQQQFTPFPRSDCVCWIELGFDGTGTQIDLSGNSNTGSVTNATVADHVPTPVFQSAPLGVPYVVAAAAAQDFPFRRYYMGVGV